MKLNVKTKSKYYYEVEWNLISKLKELGFSFTTRKDDYGEVVYYPNESIRVSVDNLVELNKILNSYEQILFEKPKTIKEDFDYIIIIQD